MTRDFQAPQKMVFDAWTKPELLRRWLAGPSGLDHDDMRHRPEGWGLLPVSMDARCQRGSKMGMKGVYREIVPQRAACGDRAVR